MVIAARNCELTIGRLHGEGSAWELQLVRALEILIGWGTAPVSETCRKNSACVKEAHLLSDSIDTESLGRSQSIKIKLVIVISTRFLSGGNGTKADIVS